MLKITIQACAKTHHDLIDAIEEVVHRAEQGNTSGLDRNQASHFTYTIEGEEDNEPVDLD